MPQKASKKAKSITYVMKDNFIQVLLPGRPFTLNKSHPTFQAMKEALKKKRWKQIPRLVNTAESIVTASHGQVEVVNGAVKYKGRTVRSALTDRIVALVEKEKPVKHMLRFMDNLYQNPSDRAVSDFYDWLVDNDLPITDDGCFLAYKAVKDNYTDTHSGTVNNRPGQIIMMSRKVANTDYDTQCATGFHVCSRHYGLYGSRVLAVKINPKHVLSAPPGGKMRVTQYEVLRDLGRGYNEEEFKRAGLAELEGKMVIEIGKERKNAIQLLLKAEAVKRLIRRRKLSKTSIMKASYARLTSMIKRFDLVPNIGPDDKFFLKKAREAAGVTVGQVAKQMDVTYRTVATIEKNENPNSTQRDNYLQALSRLTGSKNITYPKTSAAVA